MNLSISVCNKLQELFFVAPSREYAINRVKDICKKYQINLHLLGFDFKSQSIEEIDNIYLLIIS